MPLLPIKGLRNRAVPVQVFAAATTQAEVFAEAGLPSCTAVLQGFDGELAADRLSAVQPTTTMIAAFQANAANTFCPSNHSET